MTDKLREAAQQDAQAVPGMGRKLYGELIAAIRNLIDAQDESARWGCVGPTEADLAWDRVTQLANYICLGLDSPPTAPTPPAQQDAQAAGESLRDLAAKYIAEDEAAESSINRLMTLGRKMADAINAAPTSPAQEKQS